MEKSDVIKTVDVQNAQVGQQLTYPLDYVSQEIIRSVAKAGIAVNGIYISTDNVNPSTVLGYGTWSAFGAGRVLVGYDAGQTEFDTAGETGGAKTHTLTTAEMPAHVHGSNLWQGNGGATNLAGGGGTGLGDTASTGGGGSHNNLQPYIVVFFWKRTA